jgi:aspartate aminotransferase
MPETARLTPELATIVSDAGAHPEQRLSSLATKLIGSEILKVAAEIRALKAAGTEVCDLTVGDFSPAEFPIPAALSDCIHQALERGETNYPPSNGLPELREAVRRFYARELAIDYPLDSVLIASGSRPAIYGLYRSVCDPGDRVVYPVPSWNNNHYSHLAGAVGVPVPCDPQDRFLPRPEALAPHLVGARLLCLNSPLNPTGTAFAEGDLRAIGEAVLAENEARERRGERPLYVLYDQVYWTLCFGDTRHVTPPGLLPELARYTVLIDGISKAFAATGLRVGWAVGPRDLVARMATLLAHVGAWAPRPEQAATAAYLEQGRLGEFRTSFHAAVLARLERLHRGLQRLKALGLPVDSLPPAGAIYLSARIHPFGRRTPAGAELRGNEDVRRYLLEAAGVAVVPFQAFGVREESGWFRLSVGAVGEAEIEGALSRLEPALQALD